MLAARLTLVSIVAVTTVFVPAAGGLAQIAPGRGRVEVRVTDHRAGIGDFRALEVTLAGVWLHPAGKPRGHGWVEVLHSGPAIDIVPLKDGRWAAVGTGLVAAGSHDAVKFRFGEVRGTLRDGTRARVAATEAAIAVDLRLEPGTTRVALIDLYVEAQDDHEPGRYVLKVRDVRVEPPQRGGNPG
jgi:hypothetical protein